MKKEIISALLLLLIFSGVLVNIRINERIVSSLINEIDMSYENLKNGNKDKAMQQLDTAIEHWLNLDGYTHIFIRHSEINSTTDAFYGFRSDVGSGDADAANGSYGLLKETLLSLMTMEQISLGSVF
jgi:hypothetical protein